MGVPILLYPQNKLTSANAVLLVTLLTTTLTVIGWLDRYTLPRRIFGGSHWSDGVHVRLHGLPALSRASPDFERSSCRRPPGLDPRKVTGVPRMGRVLSPTADGALKPGLRGKAVTPPDANHPTPKLRLAALEPLIGLADNRSPASPPLSAPAHADTPHTLAC